MREITSIEIRDQDHVGMVRRSVHEYASRFDFTETELAEIDIVVQEIGTNSALYSSAGGWLHFSSPVGPAPGLELFYWDKGPGIHDIDRSICDGVSTGGTLGSGFGAIRRLMDACEVYSNVKTTERSALPPRRTSHGTAILARKWVGGSSAEDKIEANRIGVWSRPLRGEELNGDAYYIGKRNGRTLLSVIDGLGHGKGAKEASDVAIDCLEEWQGEHLDEVLLTVHNALRATRGAVMGATVLDNEEGWFHYAGVGNIEVRVFNTPEPVRPIPTNGTLGARSGNIRVWTHRWTEGATVVMSSDGVSSSWDMSSYPDLLKRSPQMIAGVLMRDYGRESDDATVLVAR